MSQPFFSVIITTYNRAAILLRALDSLLAQTELSWEGVIIDDGSTDHTTQVVMPYLRKSSKFIYKKQNNGGEEAAKNAGIKIATGKYITFLDSDDAYKSNHLKIRKNILLTHPDVDILHGGVEIKGSVFVPNRHNPSQKIHLKDCVIGGTFFVKKKVMLSAGGFQKVNIGTDADLFERLVKKGATSFKVSHPTYIYNRLNPNSITQNFNA